MKKWISLSILFVLFLSVASAQSRSELERRKQQLVREMELANKMLDQTRQTQKVTLDELVTLNRRIGNREELIRTINREIRLLSREIEKKNEKINGLQEELEELKDEYAAMIRFADRNRDSYDKLMFLFSAENFNQAYKRLKYLQQYSDYRKKQAQFILETATELNKEVAALERDKQTKSQLLLDQQKEKVALGQEQEKQTKYVTVLQAKEKQLLQQVKDNARAARSLSAKIEEIIKKEIEEARRLAAAKGAGNTAEASAVAELTSKFESGKGRLSWPVDQGLITQNFGIHPHPVLRGVTIKSDGIDIRTPKESKVKAIATGVVTMVANVPEYQTMIIVTHGDYRSVYAKLSEAVVKKGDLVVVGQVLGEVHFNEKNNKSEVHLQLWKSTVKMNPADWIIKK